MHSSTHDEAEHQKPATTGASCARLVDDRPRVEERRELLIAFLPGIGLAILLCLAVAGRVRARHKRRHDTLVRHSASGRIKEQK